jgi:hypothetical protein
MHTYLNWAKERIDEMDAILASLEAKVGEMQAETKVKADQLIAELGKRRDEFRARVKEDAKAGEAAWERTKPELESRWKGSESWTAYGTALAESRKAFDRANQAAWAAFKGATSPTA